MGKQRWHVPIEASGYITVNTNKARVSGGAKWSQCDFIEARRNCLARKLFGKKNHKYFSICSSYFSYYYDYYINKSWSANWAHAGLFVAKVQKCQWFQVAYFGSTICKWDNLGQTKWFLKSTTVYDLGSLKGRFEQQCCAEALWGDTGKIQDCTVIQKKYLYAGSAEECMAGKIADKLATGGYSDWFLCCQWLTRWRLTGE